MTESQLFPRRRVNHFELLYRRSIKGGGRVEREAILAERGEAGFEEEGKIPLATWWYAAQVRSLLFLLLLPFPSGSRFVSRERKNLGRKGIKGCCEAVYTIVQRERNEGFRKGFGGKRYSIFVGSLLPASRDNACLYPRFSSYPKLIKPTPTNARIFLSNSFKEEQLFLSFLFSLYFYTIRPRVCSSQFPREIERERESRESFETKFDRGRNSPLFVKRRKGKKNTLRGNIG